MDWDDLKELHYIAPIENVPSIVELGILSHSRAAQLPHRSVAMPEMQDRRAKRTVPSGKKLHEYANLYICGRNPMLYLRRDDEVCVIGIDPTVLYLPGAIVTDANAGGDYARFASGPTGLSIVDRGRTFARYWTDADPIEYWRKKTAKCAEVLVPNRVEAKYCNHAYVRDEEKAHVLNGLATGLSVRIDRDLFFS